MVCKKCGNEMSDDSMFCQKCGTPVEQKKLCSKCGNELSEDAVFCQKCGTPVEQKNLCSKCGAELYKGAAFCRSCGASVDVNSSSPIGGNSGAAAVVDANKKLFIIIGAVCILVLCVVISVFSSSKDKEKETEKNSIVKEQEMEVKEENILAICDSNDADYIVTEKEIQPAITLLRNSMKESGYELSDDAFYFVFYDYTERRNNGDEIYIDNYRVTIFDGHYKYLCDDLYTTINGDDISLTMYGNGGELPLSKALPDMVERKNNNFYGIPNSELGRKILESDLTYVFD